MTETTPWKADVQSSTQPVVYAYTALLHAGVLLQPVIPGKAAELLDRLGVSASHRTLASLEWRPAQVDVQTIRDRLEKNKRGPLFAPIKKASGPGARRRT